MALIPQVFPCVSHIIEMDLFWQRDKECGRETVDIVLSSGHNGYDNTVLACSLPLAPEELLLELCGGENLKLGGYIDAGLRNLFRLPVERDAIPERIAAFHYIEKDTSSYSCTLIIPLRNTAPTNWAIVYGVMQECIFGATAEGEPLADEDLYEDIMKDYYFLQVDLLDPGDESFHAFSTFEEVRRYYALYINGDD